MKHPITTGILDVAGRPRQRRKWWALGADATSIAIRRARYFKLILDRHRDLPDRHDAVSVNRRCGHARNPPTG